MAISPQKLDLNFRAEVDEFERKIDATLMDCKLPPNGNVNIDTPSGMSYTHFEMLRERYIVAGWKKVEYRSEQREGNWLEFKA